MRWSELICNYIVQFSRYFDTIYDRELFRDDIALNMLYILTSDDVERGNIIATREIRDQLTHLQSKGNKKEVTELSTWCDGGGISACRANDRFIYFSTWKLRNRCHRMAASNFPTA